VHRILVRHGLNHLARLDRPTREVVRRYEQARPGELVHVDIKKLGNIPDGAGHKVMDRRTALDNKIATTAQRRTGRLFRYIEIEHNRSRLLGHPGYGYVTPLETRALLRQDLTPAASPTPPSHHGPVAGRHREILTSGTVREALGSRPRSHSSEDQTGLESALLASALASETTFSTATGRLDVRQDRFHPRRPRR
jgi:hypothetical protein